MACLRQGVSFEDARIGINSGFSREVLTGSVNDLASFLGYSAYSYFQAMEDPDNFESCLRDALDQALDRANGETKQ